MKNSVRTQNSKYSAISAIIANAVKILIGFIAQKIFIITLGAEYLGLNGLFSNIVAMLAIAELGIGSAIMYSLYEPIAKKDYKKVKQLAIYYKRAYKIIAIVIALVGLCIAPAVPFFASDTSINNIAGFYLLFLLDTVLTYVVAYKSSLLNAHQKNYIVNVIQTVYLVVLNIGQIAFLLLTKQYVFYLIIRIIARLFENTLISIYYKKNFEYLDSVNESVLDGALRKDINKKVKALFIHKISTFLVSGTDNLIISKFLGLTIVGMYSNYSMIINSIQALFSQMFNSVISSVGNLLTEKNVQKSYHIYDKMLFLNYWIIAFCGICIFFLMEPFITLWVGESYLLATQVLFVLVLVFYSSGMRNAPAAFKSAGGIFVEDRFVPIIEALFNLVFSLILVNTMGLIGVFIGTFLSSLVLHLYSYPIFVYKKIFNRRPMGYVVEQLKYASLFMLLFGVTYLVSRPITRIDDVAARLGLNLIVCLIIPNTINLTIFWKSDKLRYFKRFIGRKR